MYSEQGHTLLTPVPGLSMSQLLTVVWVGVDSAVLLKRFYPVSHTLEKNERRLPSKSQSLKFFAVSLRAHCVLACACAEC